MESSNNSPLPQQVPVYITTQLPKSRVTYVILGLLFGGLGIHNFYAGYYWRAIAQILLSIIIGIVTLGMGLFVIGIWVLIEVIVVTKDARGIPFA